MAISGLRNWHTVRVDANLTFLPQTLDLSPRRSPAIMLILFGGGWIGFAIVAVGGVTTLQQDELIFLAISTPIGMSFMGWGLTQLFRRHQAILSTDGVEVTERGLFGVRAWYEPYGAFKGVLYRRIVVRRKRSTRVYQVIELLHEDRHKCVPLFVEQSSEVPRSRWESYAQRLKLPAIEIEGDALSVRGHDDLDKTLGELVEEGKVSHAFDPDAPAPEGLVVTRDHADAFTIAITAPRFPLWFLGIFLAMGVGLFAGAFLGGQKPVLMACTGLVFSAVAILLLHRDRSSARAIRLDRSRLTVDDAFRGRRRTPSTLSFGEIESITLRTEDGNMGRELVIAGDAGQIQVGSGLSHEALKWLRNFLIAAITTA